MGLSHFWRAPPFSWPKSLALRLRLGHSLCPGWTRPLYLFCWGFLPHNSHSGFHDILPFHSSGGQLSSPLFFRQPFLLRLQLRWGFYGTVAGPSCGQSLPQLLGVSITFSPGCCCWGSFPRFKLRSWSFSYLVVLPFPLEGLLVSSNFVSNCKIWLLKAKTFAFLFTKVVLNLHLL